MVKFYSLSDLPTTCDLQRDAKTLMGQPGRVEQQPARQCSRVSGLLQYWCQVLTSTCWWYAAVLSLYPHIAPYVYDWLGIQVSIYSVLQHCQLTAPPSGSQRTTPSRATYDYHRRQFGEQFICQLFLLAWMKYSVTDFKLLNDPWYLYLDMGTLDLWLPTMSE